MREKIRKHQKGVVISTLFILAGLMVLILLGGYIFGWDWVGVTSTISLSHPTNTTFLPGKTIWDWLQLLIIPAVLAAGGLWFNSQQSERQQRLSDEQHRKDQELAEERRKADLELALDQQRENALQTYLDRMADLLIKGELGNPKKLKVEVQQVARARTLTVLRQLDNGRKAALLKFLHEAQLIKKENAIIDLTEADLSEADLDGANLSGAKLDSANLSGATLIRANLSGAALLSADLSGAALLSANLSGADLSEAYLDGANLNGANLIRANLSGADLGGDYLDEANPIGEKLSLADSERTIIYVFDMSGPLRHEADLTEADLTEANLSGAMITPKQLAKAHSLDGATLPDGSKYSKPA